LSERETIDKVKQKQGIFSKIQNFFTLGYGTKEDLRELDKKLRDLYYVELRDMRHVWEELYLAAMDANAAQSRDFKKVIQILDRVEEKVRHADYGYAGLWDRKGHIRENELARVFNVDKGVGKDLDALKASVTTAKDEADAANWESLSAEVKNVKSLLLAFEDKWDERETKFRPLDM
jgi:RNAse (barnase) inhibitor barstar